MALQLSDQTDQSERSMENDAWYRTPDQSPARILLATVGSLGDLHPCIGLALELKRRGHRVTIASTEYYRSKIEQLDLAFRPIRPDFNPTDGEMIAKCQNIRRGPEILIREIVLPHLEESYTDLLAAAAGADLMLSGELLYPAPIVAEKLGLLWASIILSPCSFLSAHDPSLLVPMPPLIHLRNAGWRLNRAILSLGVMSTHSWWKPVRALRRREGLGPGGSPLTEGKFSPHLVLALFSRGLAKAQPDWPASSVQPGFVFYDRGNEADRVTTDMRTFLASGEAPIVFTQGSTAVHNAGSFYEVSTEAVKRLGKRALLIGATPIPQFQDPSLFVAPYAPYSEVFANASVIVHQGGSGTTGQAMRAGVPTLIVPYGWDQPDNAVRIERAGAGLTLPRKRYTAESAADALARLISDPGYGRRAAELRAQIEAEDATTAACDAIENLLARKRGNGTR
jgi:rhamnosyltransferase subunit B